MISVKELYDIYLGNPLISTDTRSIVRGSLFFALKGPSFNGNRFASDALEKGAAFAIIDEKEFKTDERFLLVDDVLDALQMLSSYHRDQLKIPVLAITGSNGKTTTKELIRAVLAKKYNTLATKGNLNNHIGVPLTILSITAETEFAVIEMGANHQKEIEGYCRIAKPDYGLITNVGKAHLEGFGGFEGVKKGKGELYEWIRDHGKGIFINAGNNFLIEMSQAVSEDNKIYYGNSEKCFCKGESSLTNSLVNISWECKAVQSEVQSNLTGEYNAENILAAICTGNYFCVNAHEINDAISSYNPDNSRSQIIYQGTNKIILDAYNANPTSMEAALKNFSLAAGKNKMIFLGEMAELGDSSESEHERISTIVKEYLFDEIFLVGQKFKKYSGILNTIYFDDSEKAAEWVLKNPPENKSILIKGSRSMKMEKILDSIPQ